MVRFSNHPLALVHNDVDILENYDLNEVVDMEFTEVIDWSKVSIDTKILVRQHNDKEWRRKYFAKYENGKIYAWVNGCTSFTAYDSSYPYTEWEQTKLYKEGVNE